MYARLRRRKLIEDWKTEAKVIQAADEGKRTLLREAKSVAMKRIEESARTEADFERVNHLWDNIQTVEDWRREKHEVIYLSNMRQYELSDTDVVIPEPELVWWRQQLSGSFLDVIFDCPYEIHELTSSRPVYELTKELNEYHKELLYYWAIRLWSPQAIAVLRGQTDRNIRKVYNVMIADLRRKIYLRLAPRYAEGLTLTTTQRRFCAEYLEGLDEKQRAKIKRKLEELERKKRKGSGEDE
jgi:hypothetical protein